MIAAVLDACVLYSAPLRDFWMHLAVQSVFQPKWTARIQDEWINNLLRNRPDLERKQLKRTRLCMEQWARDWEAPCDETRLAEYVLPDADDRHVLCAAVGGRTHVIVTFNISDFPEDALSPHGVRAVHPDTFALELLADDPDAFVEAVRAHRAALVKPTMDAATYLQTLERAGLPMTSARLRLHVI